MSRIETMFIFPAQSQCIKDHAKDRYIGGGKLRWSDVMKKDTKEKGVKIEEAQYRRTWKLKT